MKKFTVATAATLLMLNTNVFADAHVDEAITHTTAAIEQGQASNARELVAHARPALEHTMVASVSAKSIARTHVEAAMLDLENAIKQGKADDSAGATTNLQSALVHLNAANKI